MQLVLEDGHTPLGPCADGGLSVEIGERDIITAWSARAESLFGWKASEVVGLRMSNLLIAAAERTEFQEWAASLPSRAAAVEQLALHRSGITFPALFRSLAPPPGGQPSSSRQLVIRALSDHVPSSRDGRTSADEWLRALLDTLPIGVWLADEHGRLIEGNPAAQEIWGGARYVSIPGYGEYKGWWPDTGKQLRADEWTLARVLEGGVTLRNELIDIESFDGKRKTILNSASPIKDTRGRTIGAVAVNQDVTELRTAQRALMASQAELEARVQERTAALSLANEQMKEHITNRKRAEEELYDEKEFLTAVLNNMEDAIVACDSDGILTVFNRAAREFHGLPETPIPPERWAEHYDLYKADGKTPLQKEDIPLYRALQGEKVQNLGMVIAPKGRKALDLVANGQPIFDSQGQKRGAIVSMHNVSDRKRAEAELRRQQSLLEYIINFVPHYIFWKDREARFLGGNKNFLRRALGVTSSEEMVGKNDYDFFPKEQAAYFRSCDFAVMESGEPLLDIEEPQDQSEGGTRILLTSKVPLRDENGSVIGLLGSFADITDRKRMEQELEEASKAAEAAARAKSDFLTTVSHELRTPLTLILGPLEMILAKQRAVLPERVVADLERVHRNAVRLYSLVNDILDFTRLEAGKAQVYWEQVDVDSVVSELAADVASAARAKDVELSLTRDPAIGVVPLDRSKFEKIVLNLLGNALKFTPRGGSIRVILRTLDDHFELSVTDSGLGIAPDQQKLLFQRFQQLDSSATRKYEGTGLGLAIVKEFATLMGGEVGLESVPGKGSTFFVRFARTADHAMVAQRELAKPILEHHAVAKRMPLGGEDDGMAPPRRRGIAIGPKVLVVEDNADMRAYVTEILEDEYIVETAENGLRALDVAHAWRPDVIISDIMMPMMDGLELVTRLKRSRELSHIPVVLLTAKTSHEDLAKGLDLGADDYLGKPFGAAELKARVRAAHRLHRALADLEVTLGNLQQSQEQLVHASKMAAVGTMIAGLSHELNNPLATISLNTKLLAKMSRLDEPAAKNALTRITAQTDRCAQLVRSLLDYSHRKQPLVESISPETLLEQVAGLAAPMAHRRGVELLLDTDSSSLRGIQLWISVQEVETALLNLLSNAIGATQDGGSISMRAQAATSGERQGVEIAVNDTGRGIAAEVLPQIFDPFFTTKPPGEGTGLGLSMTRKIVESHGGTITVDSKEDHGTSVRIWLPSKE